MDGGESEFLLLQKSRVLGERFPATSNYTTWQELWPQENTKNQPFSHCRLRSWHPTEESTCSTTYCSLAFSALTVPWAMLGLAVQRRIRLSSGFQSGQGAALYPGWHTVNNPQDPSPERDLFFNMNYNNHGLKHTLFYIQLRKEMDLKMLSLGYFFKTDFSRKFSAKEFGCFCDVCSLMWFPHSSMPQKTTLKFHTTALMSQEQKQDLTLLLRWPHPQRWGQNTEITLHTGQWGLVQR